MTVEKAGNYSKLRVEYLPLSSLEPASRNPKKHQIETVLASMSRFGYVAPEQENADAGQFGRATGSLDRFLGRKLAGGLVVPSTRQAEADVGFRRSRRVKGSGTGGKVRLPRIRAALPEAGEYYLATGSRWIEH